ncbi:MAG: HIT domain-containing protein [Minisyncoccia bacterium]
MSELRQDLTSGDWVLLAPGRASRPKFLDKKKPVRKPTLKSTCPFEDLKKSGNWPPILALPSEKKWEIVVLPNKYPAIARGPICSMAFRHGIYHARTAVGTHNLLVTRDHDKHFADLSKTEAAKVFEVFQALHRMAAKDRCAAYVSSFYNYGPEAGASVWHPHYQILTLPIIPPHNVRSLRGTSDYYKKFGRCVRCDIIKVESKKNTRVIFENEHAIALAPYASKRPFEVSVIPKKHWASFRETSPAAVRDVAHALQSVMQWIRKYVNDPDLNFFIHDTPLDNKDYRHHHWHIEVIPRTSFEAGFEFSTQIDINVVDPDNAAAILRGRGKKTKFAIPH